MKNNNSISGLEDHLGYWLRFVSNAVSHAFSLKLEAEGVTVAEWVMLRGLWDVTEITPSGLAEKMGMTRGAISKLVERLEAKGLLAREHDTGDRRYQSIALTRSGRAIVPRLAELADKNDAEFFGQFDDEHKRDLMALLKELVAQQQLKGPVLK
jgi:DNA-binding MarR family transcriptional regulator